MKKSPEEKAVNLTMNGAGIIIAIVLFLVVLFAAVIRSRRANPEQSTTEMHPDNFKKPTTEMVEKNNEHSNNE